MASPVFVACVYVALPQLESRSLNNGTAINPCLQTTPQRHLFVHGQVGSSFAKKTHCAKFILQFGRWINKDPKWFRYKTTLLRRLISRWFIRISEWKRLSLVLHLGVASSCSAVYCVLLGRERQFRRGLRAPAMKYLSTESFAFLAWKRRRSNLPDTVSR